MIRVSYLAALLSAIPAVAADQRWFTKFSHGFAATPDPTVIFAVSGGMLALVGVIVMFEIIKSHARVAARVKLSWEQFFSNAQEKELRPTEVSFLESIVQRASLPNAEAIFHSPGAFEDVVEHYYAEHPGGIHKVSKEDFAMVGVLRDRLGYANLPVEAPYITSRQFRVGDRLAVQFPHLNRSGMATIQKLDEISWSITNPLSQAISPDSEVRLSLTRGGDAEYQISTTVLGTSEGVVELAHTRDLNRKQLRNWVRVDVSLPVKVRVLEAAGDSPIPLGQLVPGRILDLSGGGMSVRLPGRLAKGTRLTLDFELAETPFRGVEVQVVRVAPSPTGADEMFQHSVSFLSLAKPLQERIVRFVFERQRQEAQWR